MKCPKCGNVSVQIVWVCARCDYILDASFLGDDILDESSRRNRTSDVFAQGADAVILGRIGDDEVQSLHSAYSGNLVQSETGPVDEPSASQVFIGADLHAFFEPNAVLRHTPDAGVRRTVLSPMEAAVFELVDGTKTVAMLHAETGLDDADLRIALALLGEKQMIERVRIDAIVENPVSIDDATRELDDLPPLATAAPASTSDLPPPFEMPEDSATGPTAPLPTPTPEVAVLSVGAFIGPSVPEPILPEKSTAAVMDAPSLRPAMAVSPLTARPRPKVEPVRLSALHEARPDGPAEPEWKARGGLQIHSAQQATSTKAAALATEVKRAAEYYEQCLRDIREGKIARAWSYAKMAADANPREEKYLALLQDWSQVTSSAGKERSSTPDVAEGQRLLALSQTAEQEQKYTEAIELMRRACELFPNSASALNRLGVLLATRAKDFKGAYSVVIKAVELEPDNAVYRNNLMKMLAKVEESGEVAPSPKSPPGGGGGFFQRLRRS